jgi:hypothetical protein
VNSRNYETHYAVFSILFTSSLLGPNILLGILLQDTISVVSKNEIPGSTPIQTNNQNRSLCEVNLYFLDEYSATGALPQDSGLL